MSTGEQEQCKVLLFQLGIFFSTYLYILIFLRTTCNSSNLKALGDYMDTFSSLVVWMGLTVIRNQGTNLAKRDLFRPAIFVHHSLAFSYVTLCYYTIFFFVVALFTLKVFHPEDSRPPISLSSYQFKAEHLTVVSDKHMVTDRNQPMLRHVEQFPDLPSIFFVKIKTKKNPWIRTQVSRQFSDH